MRSSVPQILTFVDAIGQGRQNVLCSRFSAIAHVDGNNRNFAARLGTQNSLPAIVVRMPSVVITEQHSSTLR
jgi:hypothetical protein